MALGVSRVCLCCSILIKQEWPPASQGRASAGSSPGDFAAGDSVSIDAMPYDRQLLQDPLNEVDIYIRICKLHGMSFYSSANLLQSTRLEFVTGGQLSGCLHEMEMPHLSFTACYSACPIYKKDSIILTN